MKSLLVLCGTFGLALTVAAGDPLAIARQRARDTSAAVSSGQAVPSRNQAAPAPAAPAAPNPAITAMQQNIASIATDLATLQSDPSKKQPLINDLNAAAQGTAPTKASLNKLAADLAVLSGKTLSPDQRTKLAQYLRAFCNSSHLSPAQQRTILEELQKLLTAAGVSAEDAAKIAADFKTIAAETK
ncbi:MAG: hypothetical protein U1F65_03105 [Verrucomicrobiota bacterium]